LIAWFNIASRNLIKNRRRSVITILAISFGFAAVNLFGGFQKYMYRGNREAAIYAQCQGHLTIVKKEFMEKGQLDPVRYLLNAREIETIEEICRTNPHVELVTPQLTISGLISNGSISTIFVGHGLVPSAVDVFLSSSRYLKKLGLNLNEKRLEEGKLYGVALATDLARLLDLKPGSDAVALATTVDGQMNALDMQVVSLFEVGVQELKDKVMQVPFRFAQKLYDTEGADRVRVLLDDLEYTESVRKELTSVFSQRGLDFDILTWQELSQWYREVKNMFDVIFLFLFIIVFVIVVMSVTNTMSMTVIERTREIGTLRALGLKRRGVLLLFAMESSLLGLCGTVCGLLLSFLGWGCFAFFKPMWTPPRVSLQIAIRVEIVPEYILYSFLFLLILSIAASLIPARRAARQNVVDALGHV